MTFREKVTKNHPEAIYPLRDGGVCGCPFSYGYESMHNPNLPCGGDTSKHNNNLCTKCWNRKVPGWTNSEDIKSTILELCDEYGFDLRNGVAQLLETFETTIKSESKENEAHEQILESLAKRNGFEQDVFVLEEMSELQKELMKHRRGKDNRDAIVDECVDVMLTIMILLRVYDTTDDEIKKIMDYKLNRLRDFLPEK